MKRILVSAIGSMAAECVIKNLICQGYGVYGMDIYPREWHPIASSCIEFFQVPKANDASYIDVIVEISRQNKIDYILPLTDPEIDVLSAHRSIFEQYQTILLLSSHKTISFCRDKASFPELFKEAHTFRCIPTYSDSQKCLAAFPALEQFVAKIRNGRSSEGIEFLSRSMLQTMRFSENYLFQPFIEGAVCTVDFARDRKGNVILCPRQELMRTKNGAGTVIQILNPNHFYESIDYIAKKLDVYGCMNIEFIRIQSGDLFLMDINPRFSAGVGFSAVCGFNFVKCHLDGILSKTFSQNEISNVPIGKILVKRYCEFCSQ